jgi:hypothetical protein
MVQLAAIIDGYPSSNLLRRVNSFFLVRIEVARSSNGGLVEQTVLESGVGVYGCNWFLH